MTSATQSSETDTIAETGTWYPRRSGLRYKFVATVEVTDRKSAKQITSRISNLSRYGCHVRTDAPFHPGTTVDLTIRIKDTVFRCEGKVIYSVRNEGMGVRFDNIASAEQVILNEWLRQASREVQERPAQESAETGTSGKHKKIVLAVYVLVAAAIVAGLFVWLRLSS